MAMSSHLVFRLHTCVVVNNTTVFIYVHSEDFGQYYKILYTDSFLVLNFTLVHYSSVLKQLRKR